MTDSAPEMPWLSVWLIAGVASSCSPVTTKVAMSNSASRWTMSQWRSVPVTWNSLGPFMDRYTTPIASNVRCTQSGHG